MDPDAREGLTVRSYLGFLAVRIAIRDESFAGFGMRGSLDR